jgi:hypothetical protein
MTKKEEIKGDICPSCGKVHGKRTDLGLKTTKEELDSLKLIQNKYSCACQAAQPGSIPDGIPKEKAESFIAGALAAKAEAQWLQQMWWEEITEKYALKDKGNVSIDFTDGSLYLYEDFEKKQH